MYCILSLEWKIDHTNHLYQFLCISPFFHHLIRELPAVVPVLFYYNIQKFNSLFTVFFHIMEPVQDFMYYSPNIYCGTTANIKSISIAAEHDSFNSKYCCSFIRWGDWKPSFHTNFTITACIYRCFVHEVPTFVWMYASTS